MSAPGGGSRVWAEPDDGCECKFKKTDLRNNVKRVVVELFYKARIVHYMWNPGANSANTTLPTTACAFPSRIARRL